MSVIINENLYDHEFVENRTQGFEELKRVVSNYPPEKVKKISGIPRQKLIDAARLYAKAERGAIMFGMGITHHSHGTNNISSICNLALLTGNLGKPGAGVNPIAKQKNGHGAGDMGCVPNIFPGAQPVNNPDVNKKFEKACFFRRNMKNPWSLPIRIIRRKYNVITLFKNMVLKPSNI